MPRSPRYAERDQGVRPRRLLRPDCFKSLSSRRFGSPAAGLAPRLARRARPTTAGQEGAYGQTADTNHLRSLLPLVGLDGSRLVSAAHYVVRGKRKGEEAP